MNAPDKAITLEAELVPLDSIVPSDTHIQQMRRKRFSDEGILEIAASIKTSGVINPILVRVLGEGARAHRDTTAKYELVAGERRWLGARRAGLAHIPCVIRELDDGQVIEAQLVENLQRDNLNPLEEAEGYAELKELKGYDAAAIGTLIGKSKSYVYARMKLTALAPEARAALEAGKLDYSKALLLARLPTSLQPKALEAVTEDDFNDEPISYKAAFADLRENFMRPLSIAPFAADDATLFHMVRVAGKKKAEEPIALPACVGCPHNSANDAELHGEIGDAHVCTNTECFQLKAVAFHERRRRELEAANVEVITGEDAKKIIPRLNKIVGYVDLDEECDSDQYPERASKQNKGETDDDFEKRENAYYDAQDKYQPRTYRKLLEGRLQPENVKLVEDPKSKRVRELVPLKLARELVAKSHQIKLPTWVGAPEPQRSNVSSAEHQKNWKEEQRKAEERRELETEYRAALAKAVAEKCNGTLGRQDLVDIADALIEEDRSDGLKRIYGKTPEPSDLKDPELCKLIRVALFAGDVGMTWGAPSALLAAAKRYKVDAGKIKKDLEAARKANAKSFPAPDETKPAAPSKKKAAKK